MKIFAFDLGKASLGICVRTDTEILELQSIQIPVKYAMTSDFRERRRAYRTRQAHKKREQWLIQGWKKANLVPLGSTDPRMQREFPSPDDDTIYNSALLRVALIQGRPLKEWQIFKALWSAIQLRGYDVNLPWAHSVDQITEEEQENRTSAELYTERLHEAISPHFEYDYPCFLAASLMRLWSAEQPEVLRLRVDHTASKVRRKPGTLSMMDAGNVAPRALVEKEIRALLTAAQKQLPQLQQINMETWLYGPAGEPYASYRINKFKHHRGKEWDSQGLLSQKIPRFDNRLMGACQLLPQRNACKAQDPLNQMFTLLIQLKNLRFSIGNGAPTESLCPEQLQQVYQQLSLKLAEPKTRQLGQLAIKTALRKVLALTKKQSIQLNVKKIEMNSSGQARFSKPALKLMTNILLSGKNPPELDLTPYIQTGTVKPITRLELEKAVSRLGKTWNQFHVGDDRNNEILQKSATERSKAILKLIGQARNPIVRHRLTVFYNELKRLTGTHQLPDRVILEFIRGEKGLNGKKRAKEWEAFIKQNEKVNAQLKDELEQLGYGNRRDSRNLLLRLKLLREQGGICPYTGNPLSEREIHLYEVEHIVPFSNTLTNDALYNKVLVIPSANSTKSNQTPYQWLAPYPSQWAEYIERIQNMKGLSAKKRQLLLSPEAHKLIERFTGLAETAHLARLAQQIISLHYGWGLSTQGDAKRIFVCNGQETAKIRNLYRLNDLLLSEQERQKLTVKEKMKKNRSNPKHHALDAYCISYSQNLMPQLKSDGDYYWTVQGIQQTLGQLQQQLESLFPDNPWRNKKDLYPKETIYGHKARSEQGKTVDYLTVRKNLVAYFKSKSEPEENKSDWKEKAVKKIKKIWDTDVRADLEQQVADIVEEQAWLALLETYQHPLRKSPVKRLLVI